MKTSEMVKKMLYEPKEVKLSVGGTKSFRSVIEFVLSNARYQDDVKMRVVTRTPQMIANLVEKEFEKEAIEKAKSVYETN